MFSLDPYEEIENTFTNLSIFTNKVSLVCSFALVKITQSAPLYYQLTKEFCNRGRGLTAEETASHSSITNFLTVDINQKSADLILCKLGDFHEDKTAV